MCKNPILRKLLFLTAWNNLQNIFVPADFRGFCALIKFTVILQSFDERFNNRIEPDRLPAVHLAVDSASSRLFGESMPRRFSGIELFRR
jgi:hypothetical protein